MAGPERQKGRVTIRTVAADSGVSVAAVSKVLRNAYGVSDGLRLRVEASIEKLGYRPSVAARGMRGQTYMIGILIVEMGNPFLPYVVDGISGALEPSKYKALIGVGHSATSIEVGLIESMIDNHMDGLILVAPRTEGEELERFARKIPMVAVAHYENSTQFDTVNSDDHLGAEMATRALVEAGHEDVAMVSYASDRALLTNVSYRREQGYLAAMKALGLEHRARILNFAVPGIALDDRSDSVQALLAMPDRPRAIFVWSDLDALPILNAARMQGIRVPQDLAIIGYDNNPIAAMPLIDLSTIDQSGQRLGALATQTLLSRIDGRSVAEHLMIEPNLVRRGSL